MASLKGLFVCRQCGKRVGTLSVRCGRCAGTGRTGFLHHRACSTCHGTGRVASLGCPDHPTTWRMAPSGARTRYRPTTLGRPGVGGTAGLGGPRRTPCFACGGTGFAKQWGLTVPCSQCRPAEHRAALRRLVPPPGYGPHGPSPL